MTEILINELSLSGQFSSADEFINGGALINFAALLKEIRNTDALLYKKYDFFEISQKSRCFGYREGDVFHVLLFDLTHDLSDDG